MVELMKKKNNERGLDKKLNLKVRQESMEIDYLNKLSDTERLLVK